MFPSFFHSIFLSGVNVIDSFMHLSPVVHISTQGQMQLCTAHFHFDSHVIQKGLSPLFLPVLYFFRVFSLVQSTKVGAWELSNPFFISIFLFWLCPSACEVLVPQPVIEPVHWEHRVLTTVPSG